VPSFHSSFLPPSAFGNGTSIKGSSDNALMEDKWGGLKRKEFSDSMTYSYKLLYTGFVCNGRSAGLKFLYIGSLAHPRQPILASSYNTYADYLASPQRSPCSFYLFSCLHLSSMMSIILLEARTRLPPSHSLSRRLVVSRVDDVSAFFILASCPHTQDTPASSPVRGLAGHVRLEVGVVLSASLLRVTVA
jgi:hypothetical protein